MGPQGNIGRMAVQVAVPQALRAVVGVCSDRNEGIFYLSLTRLPIAQRFDRRLASAFMSRPTQVAAPPLPRVTGSTSSLPLFSSSPAPAPLVLISSRTVVVVAAPVGHPPARGAGRRCHLEEACDRRLYLSFPPSTRQV